MKKTIAVHSDEIACEIKNDDILVLQTDQQNMMMSYDTALDLIFALSEALAKMDELVVSPPSEKPSYLN